MKNGLFTLDWASLGDAVAVSIVIAVAGAAGSLVSTSGFDIFSANWVVIGHNMANLAVISGVTSLCKDLLSTDSGSFLGIGPANTPSQG